MNSSSNEGNLQLSQGTKLRSASVGAIPREKKHFPSRNESASGITLDVRCACQYFQCDSLLPERVNPAGSRPESNLGFISDISGAIQSSAIPSFHHTSDFESHQHQGRNQDADRISFRSFGGQRSLDRVSNKSFDMTTQPIDPEELARQGLIVRSIVEPSSFAEDYTMTSPLSSTGFTRGVSIDRISQRSFGGGGGGGSGGIKQDFDTISHRSFSGIRRIESRSGSKQDLYVADISLPTTQVGIHSRRSSKTELPHFNVISPTPTTTTPFGGNKPDFSVYEEFRKNKVGLEEKENLPANNIMRQKPLAITKQSSLPRYFKSKTSENIMDTSINVQDIGPVYQPTTIPKNEPKQIEIQTLSIDLSTEILEVRDDPKMADPIEVVEEGKKTESHPSSPMSSPKLPHKKEDEDYPHFSLSGSPPRSMSPPSSPSSGYFGTLSASPPHSFASSRVEAHNNARDIPLTQQQRFSPERNVAETFHKREPVDQTILHATLSIPSGRMSPQTTSYKVSGTATSFEALDFVEFPQSRGSSPKKYSDSLKKPERSTTLKLPAQSYPNLSSNQQNNSTKEKSSFTLFGRKRSKDGMSPERPTRKKKDKPQKENSPIKEKIPERDKSPFRFFGKNSKEKSPIRENSPARERSPFRLFGTDNKEKSPKRERSGSMFLNQFSREKSPSRERSPSLFPNAMRRKSSAKPELIMMNVGESNQIMSMAGPTKITLDKSNTQPVVATACHETFSLKVDELDQYSSKPKPTVTSNIPSRYSSQQLKVSTIDLNEPFQNQPIGFRQQSTISSISSSQTLLMNRSITSSHPNLLNLSETRESRVTPSFTPATSNISPAANFAATPIGPNLVSVPIGIPQLTSQYDEHTYDTSYFEEEDAILQDRNSPITQAIFNRHLDPEMKQMAARTPSEQRIRQSSLLRRKNYFDRTQSQDRAYSSQDSANDNIIGRMSKTVSFDFVDHRSSRLDEHEKSKFKVASSLEKSDWLEKSYFMRDHEYEPIGEPQDDGTTQQQQQQQQQQTTSILKKESTPQPSVVPSVQISQPMEVDQDIKASAEAAMELLQKDLEERYFSSATTTPRSNSRADTDIHTSQVDTSALEELPLKAENRRKGFMASAQDRSRRFKAGIRNQAGKVKTKVRGIKKPAFKKPTLIKKETITKTKIGDEIVVSAVVTETEVAKTEISPTITTTTTTTTTAATSEPKPKKRFSNIKMPDMPKFKSPDMSKLKAKAPDFKKIEFKRPEFTKVDMSKFKIPEKFSSLKLKRSRSFKEGETSIQTAESGTTPESAAQEKGTPSKKKFEFNFGTYPRALRRKKIRDSIENITKPTDISTQPSNETPQSIESTQPPVQRGTRDKGPVGSRWADKFSDVSYGGDSESGRFQRYGSEIESFDRESSVERRMKDDLIAQEEAELAIIGDPSRKQFVEFDEENREIHKISKDREEEFKHRRPMIHQDSNISEESRDVGWSERDATRNKMLRRAEMESENYSNNYPSEEGLTNQETQSTGSSTFKKGVIEEIDDDEFFLRKRGISQDNIEIRQYISTAIREGFDNPINALQQLGSSQGEYPDSMIGISSDNVEFGYNVPRTPPRKPKRHHKQRYNDLARDVGDSQDISQEYDVEQKENYGDNISLPQTGSDFFKNIPPNRPLRKSKQGYAQDSQSDIPYFEDIDKDFYQHKEINLEDPNMMVPAPYKYDAEEEEELHFQDMSAKPVAPKRRKKRQAQSEERDLILNGFGGRSVSNSYLQDNIQLQDMIVYRTEHEYVIPLAKPESYEGTPDMNDERSVSRTNNEEDDRTSRGAESFIDEALVILESGVNGQKFKIEMEETNGYAVVRKEPPPRPPPPSRHKKSPGRFATMPLPKKSPPPERPKRNYSTIAPARPPRKQLSLENMEEAGSNVTQYEELDIDENLHRRPESPSKLKSGEIINKMKYRPLPPPPRPPREKKEKPKNKFQRDEFDDHDDEGEIDKTFEVEISTQTDPLPDDFVFEEFEITDDMKIIEPRHSRTLEDILKDDDKEMEGVKWNENDDNLTRGIQRFRESTQRSFSEKSRASSAADRSKSHSRPQTPAAIVVEKRVPTPIPNSKTNETMLEASLTVQPIDDVDLEETANKTSLHGDGSFNDSASYQASTVKSLDGHSAGDEEQRLSDFNTDEQLEREEEEREKLREEMRRIQREKEEEEERLIMEKIRELQRLEEEEERRTTEKLKELEVLEQQEKRRLQKQEEAEELKCREEQDRRILEKIKELEQQEEEDRRIMEKLKQLEKEFSAAEEIEKREAEAKEKERPMEENELIKESLEVPSRPPRKRSVPNVTEEDAVETETLSSVSEKPMAHISSESSRSTLPTHMALADLEVERLRVHALQAGHIMVSNLHGSQVAADELECKAGNLVVRNLELPPGFIENIVERVRSTERTHVQVETQTIESEERPRSDITNTEERDSRSSEAQMKQQQQIQHLYEQRPFIPEDLPPRPPLPSAMFPSEYMHSIPPAAFYQLRNPDEEEYQPNLQAPRRRRHYRRRSSSSDEDHHRRRSRSRRSPEPSVAQLGGQFLQACGSSMLQRLSQVANVVRLSSKEGGERNIGILIAMFILMTLGFLLMAMSGKNIHHHHWDFFNPPNNEGRRQM